MSKEEKENEEENQAGIDKETTIMVAGNVVDESQDNFLTAYRLIITEAWVKQLAKKSQLYDQLKKMIDKEVDEIESSSEE